MIQMMTSPIFPFLTILATKPGICLREIHILPFFLSSIREKTDLFAIPVLVVESVYSTAEFFMQKNLILYEDDGHNFHMKIHMMILILLLILNANLFILFSFYLNPFIVFNKETTIIPKPQVWITNSELWS